VIHLESSIRSVAAHTTSFSLALRASSVQSGFPGFGLFGFSGSAGNTQW
jgi:hypothetical protein